MESRRQFLANLALASAAGAVSGCRSFWGSDGARPSARQLVWQGQELGMFFHIDLPIWKPGWDWRSWKDYPDPSLYNPAKLDTDQWMEAAKAMGAKYVVLVAKHCSGFLQWQSDIYPYGVRQSPWRNGKGDLVPASDFAQYRRFGENIRRRFANCLASAAGEGDLVTLKLPETASVGQVVIEEDLSLGHCVRGYEVRAELPEGGEKTLCAGSCVGHKRIETFTSTPVKALHLRITQSRGLPKVRRFSAYNC